MKLLKHPFVAALLLFSLHGKAQNIFPEKFTGCNTDHFSLEHDSIEVKKSADELLNGITQHFTPETKKKIRGELKLQVIVDLNGNSCLISVENKTNMTTSELDLKTNIDKNLIWDKPTEKVSPLIVLNFKKGTILIRRFGLDGNTGFHELKQ